MSIEQRRRDWIPPVIVRYVPIMRWARSYERAWLRADLVAGATVWGVMTPVAMAYAAMAGLPPEAGLYAALAALMGYAIFGTSHQLQVTTSSSMAVMSAAVVAPLAGGDSVLYAALSATLALVVGALLVIMGVIRLGFIADFLSKSVVVGFIFGLAITIAIGQAPKLFGLPSGSGNALQQLWQLLTNLGAANPWTLAVGCAALLVIVVLKRLAPGVPAGLVALALGVIASSLFHLGAHGVALVGPVPLGLPAPGVSRVPWSDIPYLIAGAAGIVFLAVGESLGSARAFAAKHRYAIDPNQELIGLGAANFGAGLLRGFTVDASLSNTATADSAGARTQLSSIITAVLIIITVVAFAGLFAYLPTAVLGAIVITAVVGLMDVGELQRFYRVRRTDFWLAMTALLGVVLTTVLTGLLIAVLLSLVIVLYRASRPDIVILGKIPGQRASYGDIDRHPENQRIPGLLILRLDAPLYFFNANIARQRMMDLVSNSDPPALGVLLDLGSSVDLDIAALDMLRELLISWREARLLVLFAQVRGSVREVLRRTDLMELIGERNIFGSVHAAVLAFSEEQAIAAQKEAQEQKTTT